MFIFKSFDTLYMGMHVRVTAGGTYNVGFLGGGRDRVRLYLLLLGSCFVFPLSLPAGDHRAMISDGRSHHTRHRAALKTKTIPADVPGPARPL